MTKPMNDESHLPKPQTLWVTKGGCVFIVTHCFRDDVGDYYISAVSADEPGEGTVLLANDWRHFASPYSINQPAKMAFASRGLYEAVLTSLSDHMQSQLMNRLGHDGADIDDEQLQIIINALQETTMDLSSHPSEALAHLFDERDNRDLNQFPEMAFDSVLHLSSVYDGLLQGTNAEGFMSAEELLVSARKGVPCTEIVGFVVLANELVRLQIATGRIKAAKSEDQLARILSWRLQDLLN